MSYKIDLTKTPHEILVDRINYVYGTDYLPSNVRFHKNESYPLNAVDLGFHNEEVKVGALFTDGVYGKRTLYLTRANLSVLLEGIVVDVPKGVYKWGSEMVPFINDALGLKLLPKDIFYKPIPSGDEYYDVEIYPFHLSFRGKIRVRFVDPTPRKLEELVHIRLLDGFKIGEYIDG